MKKSIYSLLTATFAIVISFGAVNSQAQSYYPQGTYNSYGYNSGYSNSLGQSVFALDQYGDQMTYIYSMEARNYCGCANTRALLAEMRRYNCHTNSLLTAYRGTCRTSFKKAACNVRSSLSKIQCLRKRARVSHQVCTLISRSCPLATYVHRNYGSFRPVPVHSSYSHHRGSTCNSGRVTHSHSRRGGIDIGSAIFGAVAGRVIHGIINH